MQEELAAIPEDLRRTLRSRARGAAPYVEEDGRRLVNFTSNNYLSLAHHPEVVEGAMAALREDGAGAGSARLITGTSPRVVVLEEELADWKGTSRALVTPTGFAAALAVLTALVGPEDGIALEKGAHACLVSGARLSGAKIAVWRRGDPGGLDYVLGRLRGRSCRRIFVVLDGVHSMDGDIADLPAILAVARAAGAMTVLDDAHATGVLGADGAGTLRHHGLAPAPDIVQVGTLSKALASQGGFLAATSEVIDLVLQRGGAFIYTTAIAPACVGAALASVRLIRRDPARVTHLRDRSFALRDALGLAPVASPILPIILGNPERALACARELLAAGALAQAIRPPTVPAGTARLRLSVQADHVLDLAANPAWLGVLRATAAIV